MTFNEFSQEHLVEDWFWFSLSCTFLFARFFVRLRTVGCKGFQGDDFFAFLTLLFVTCDAVTVHIALYTGQNLSVTAADLAHLTDQEIHTLEYGSKIQLIAWYSYPALIWSMKFTVLFFYKRLTLGSFHARMVKYLMIFCGICYFVCLMVITFGCFPFHLNWQVKPLAPWKCRFRPQNTLTVSILNVVTDAAILAIPISMLWKLKVPLKKKLVIGVILSSGMFVIAAAIIRAVVTLHGTPSGTNINSWGVRETVLGVLTVNIPILRPILSKAFWRSGPYETSGGSSSSGHTGSKLRSNWKASRLPDSKVSGNAFELGEQSGRRPYQVGVLSHSSSQENIIKSDRDKENDNVVVIHTTLEIEHADRDGSDSLSEQGRSVWTNKIDAGYRRP